METDSEITQEVSNHLSEYSSRLCEEGYESAESYLARLSTREIGNMSPHLRDEQIHAYMRILNVQGEEAAHSYFGSLPKGVREDISEDLHIVVALRRAVKAKSN